MKMCMTLQGGVSRQNDLMKHVVGIVLHFHSWCIRSWIIVVIIHTFQTFYYGRVWGVSVDQDLVFSKLYL